MKPIHIKGKDYELYATTGTVTRSEKSRETNVHGSGGGGYTNNGYGQTSNVRIYSTTTEHDLLFMQDGNGNEHSYQLQDFGLACNTGHEITVLQAVEKTKDRGPYIVVHNHSTRKTFSQQATLNSMFRDNRWITWLKFGGPGLVLGYFMGGGLGAFIVALIGIGIGDAFWKRSGRKDAAQFVEQLNFNDFR